MRRLLFILIVLSCLVTGFAQKTITPETALNAYVYNDDKTWGWEIRKSHNIEKTNVYSLLFISQKWHDIMWKHELIIYVPETIKNDGALLFIEGGSISDGIPKYKKEDDSFSVYLSALAERNNAYVCLLKQTPNQPLYGGLKEDALISYTLNEFKKDNDFSWPLLFPMTKTAYKAMDVIQEFTQQQSGKKVSNFLVSGASKRGWTTWLTGSLQDPRVKAIAPMVIDMLNMPVSLDYQKELYGEYSEQIQDYVKLEIPQAIHSEFGNATVQMIDPYSYRKRLTVPKMIFMGTNDPYWTVDAVKHYIDEIPGHNLLHYVPNAGHDLGDKVQALEALSAFYSLMLNGGDYPSCDWEINEKGKNIILQVKGSSKNLVGARLWKSNSDSRDFRKAVWTKENIALEGKDKNLVNVKLKYPKTGFKAFYVDLVYNDIHDEEYTVSTRIYVSDKKKVFVK